MFGYVNISKGTISEEDKKLYSAYYCGLCKTIAKKSQIYAMTLSNDITFLAILLNALSKDEPVLLEGKQCFIHPVKKHNEVADNNVLDYASDMNILLVYLKVCDDVNDDKRIIDKLKKYIFRLKALRVKNKYPQISEKIIKNLKRLSLLEDEKSGSLDEVADCFGKILEAVFTPNNLDLSINELEVLGWIGYNIGRWIYIIDAYADLEKDVKKSSYNPFIYCNESILNNIESSLLLTLSNIANAYDLLDVVRNDSLIKNFLFSGLAEIQAHILKQSEETDESL